MIKFYNTGKEFLTENDSFLSTNRHLAMFFTMDAGLLKNVDTNNYAIAVTNGQNRLVALKKEPYNLLLFGDGILSKELFDALNNAGCCYENILGSEDTCEQAIKILADYGKNYYEALAMDYMQATEVTEPSCSEVSVPTQDDIDEIFECLQCFVKDCGLLDVPKVEGVRKYLDCYLIYRIDGKIVSMAMASNGLTDSMHITAVYTRPEYRNRGYARKVVNTLKNNIIASGKVATLNVDKTNPYSNKLYASIGFSKLFSQGEYRLHQTE